MVGAWADARPVLQNSNVAIGNVEIIYARQQVQYPKGRITMAERQLVVYRDGDTIAQAGAQRTLLAILDTLSAQPQPERFDLALTGGSDSLKALSYMASNPLTQVIDWSRVHIWWGDERFVAADDEDRNALQAPAQVPGCAGQRWSPSCGEYPRDARRHPLPRAGRRRCRRQ
jgi:hypothetical protein